MSRLSLSIPYMDIEDSAREQIENVLSHSFVEKLAIMPDVHAGYGLPVGGVALLRGYISPNYVGPDIGCGMDFIDTGLIYNPSIMTHETLVDIFNEMRSVIPVGFARRGNNKYVPSSYTWIEKYLDNFPIEIRENVSNDCLAQMGTLGGGNHFIEVGVNSNSHICITIHSGSRHIGQLVYTHFKTMYGDFIEVGSSGFDAYMSAYNGAINFALMSRMVMINTVSNIVLSHSSGLQNNGTGMFIEKVHNTVDAYGENGMYLHRKGSISANNGEYDIIPANQRDGVFLVRGLGNSEFLCSASHGCGRKMSRGEAKRTINMDEFISTMGDIVCRTDESIIDEAPMAYKDYNYVMSHLVENGQVEVVDRIRPLISLKG